MANHVHTADGMRITLDESIQYIGDFKRFQIILASMFCLMMFPSTYQVLLLVFGALDPSWRCANNSSLCTSNFTFPPSNKLRCSLSRDDWEYTESKEYSIITWFDIYCDNYWLVYLSKSVVFVGWGAACPPIGYVCDRYGRKKVIFLSTLIVIVSGFASAFAPNIYLLIFLRFLAGCGVAGTNGQMMILLSEMVGPKYRPHIGILLWIFFPVSLCVLALKAYYIRTWRTLFIACSMPYAFVLFFYAFSPESPRLLRLQNKNDELMTTLERIAVMNKRSLPKSLEILNPEELINRKPSPKQLVNTQKVRYTFLIQSYVFFTYGLLYYGFYMAASSIGGSVYLNFFLLSAVAVLGSVAAIFIADRCGRKPSSIASTLCASIACIILALTPLHLNIVRIAGGLTGIISTSLGFKIIGVWRIELFPTNIRSIAVGFTTIFTRAGASSSPWLVGCLTSVHPSAPYICMLVVGLVCAGLTCLLSEKKGTPLPDTVMDLVIERKDRSAADEAEDLLS